MRKTTVIFHAADYDGIFCREIARKFLPDAELIGWDFGDNPLKLPELGDRLYVMDLPLDRPFGFTSAGWATQDSDVIWIDHHKSSIESHPKNIPGYRLGGVAACRLAWQWFNLGKEGYAVNVPTTKEPYIERRVTEPLAVRLAGEHDIWDHRDPRVELFQYGLDACGEHLPWDVMLDPECVNTINDMCERGGFAKAVIDKRNADTMKERSFFWWISRG